MYLSLNDSVIPDHGHVYISVIGLTNDNGLLCHTNRLLQAGYSNTKGNWFIPSGTRINEDDVKGFTRNRGSKVVRLIRTTTGTPPEGMYWCSIPNDTSTLHTIYVGIYNHGRGMNSFRNSILVCYYSLLSMRHCLCFFINFTCREHHIAWQYNFHSKH